MKLDIEEYEKVALFMWLLVGVATVVPVIVWWPK